MSDDTDPVRLAAELAAFRHTAEVIGMELDFDGVVARSLRSSCDLLTTSKAALYVRTSDDSAELERVALHELDETAAPLALDVERIELHAKAHGLLAVPVRVDGETLGAALFSCARPESLCGSLVQTISALVRLEVVAATRARGLSEINHRARLAVRLHDFGQRALRALDERELHRLIVTTALQLTGAESGVLARVEGDELRVIYSVADHDDLVGRTVPWREDREVREAVSAPTPFVLEDTTPYREENGLIGRGVRAFSTASLLALPIHYHGTPLGVLFCASSKRRRYRSEDVEAAMLLASYSAEMLERMRAQALLEQQNRRFAETLEHLPVMIAILNRQGELVSINEYGRQFQREFLLSDDKNWVEKALQIGYFTLDGKPIPFSELQVARAFAGESPGTSELVLVSPDRQRKLFVMAASYPIHYAADGGVDEIVSTFLDVTEQRALAESKDRFLRVASHELRSPLTSLRATTGLLELDPSSLDDPARRATLIARINRQVDRLTHLVDQLMDSARLNAKELPLRYEDVDLLELCRECVDHLALSRERPVELSSRGDCRGRWDRLRIEQVLTNLCTNAARYSPANSTIDVEIVGDEHSCVLHVADRGIGVPADQLPRLFTAFFRASNSQAQRGGLGLGLYISSEIVRRHGGKIEAEPRSGGGMVFTVRLPKQPAEP